MTLQQFFLENPNTALAFSGGADSSFLLWAAKKYGANICAYYVKTAFQPDFELEDAKRLTVELGMPMTVIEADVLSVPGVAENGPDRCYHCKRALFSMLWKSARRDGFTVLLDGTNASDDVKDRPGIRALQELEVRSPLRECGITKEEIRRCSKEANLFTWNKPAYACLATRIPTGTAITADALKKAERAEAKLFEMGFTDFRIRLLGDAARIQLPKEQMERAGREYSAIYDALKQDFSAVVLDLAARQASI